MLPSVTGGENGAGITCSIENDGTAENPIESRSVICRAIPIGIVTSMGWDNASTVAQEVKDPQRNYPRAMIWAAVLVAFTYILPLLAMAVSGLSIDKFATGDWMPAAASLGGPLLGTAVATGGVICGIGMGRAPIPATSIDVIANFFQVLGVQPAMGRAFREEDGRNGAAPVVLLTDA